MRINGYIVKAEFARKTRGEQYFFVNNRFIKHPYLHHAIENAYLEMIAKDSFPGYFLNIEVDPANIDINIHPTKTEVNFLDVKLVYAILHAAVRKAIGQHNLSPMIDFEESPNPDIDFGEVVKSSHSIVQPTIPIDENYNPFNKPLSNVLSPSFQSSSFHSERPINTGDWRLLYGDRVDQREEPTPKETQTSNHYMQVYQSYILTSVKSGVSVIDQHLAHMRVLFEKYQKQLENSNGISQQELFPQPVSLNINDASLLKELMPDLENLGFRLEQANPTTFMINGTPADSAGTDAVMLLEKILENYKLNRTDLQLDRKLNLAKTMAAQLSIKPQTPLSEAEMQHLVDQLFACNVAEVAHNGKKTYAILTIDEILSRFN